MKKRPLLATATLLAGLTAIALFAYGLNGMTTFVDLSRWPWFVASLLCSALFALGKSRLDAPTDGGSGSTHWLQLGSTRNGMGKSVVDDRNSFHQFVFAPPRSGMSVSVMSHIVENAGRTAIQEKPGERGFWQWLRAAWRRITNF